MAQLIKEVQTDEESLRRKLERAELGKDFSFAGRAFTAKVVDFYDGDTIRVVFEFGGELVQYKARLAGYDSPEMKPLKTSANRDAEKIAARAARASLAEKIADQLIRIECGDFDKYGRLLVTAFAAGGENINEWMVAQGYGVPYAGGKKTQFASA